MHEPSSTCMLKVDRLTDFSYLVLFFPYHAYRHYSLISRRQLDLVGYTFQFVSRGYLGKSNAAYIQHFLKAQQALVLTRISVAATRDRTPASPGLP